MLDAIDNDSSVNENVYAMGEDEVEEEDAAIYSDADRALAVTRG